MAYIGKSPSGTGVRQRYYFTATGGETSLSGTDDNGLTLSYSDGAYVDVLLNGIELVAGTDYNTSTANTIAGLSALAASDVVTVTVYDIFTVADTVSAKDGGTFSSNVTFNGNINAGTIKDATGTNTGLTIDSSGSVNFPNTIEIDLWALQSDFATDAATPTDWARNTSNNGAYVGTGMSVSSGVFSFPRTGIYKITGSMFFVVGGSDATAAIIMQVTTDNSTYNTALVTPEGNRNASDVSCHAGFQYILDVTDTSNVKVKLLTNSFGSGTSLRGNSGFVETNIIFERIADT